MDIRSFVLFDDESTNFELAVHQGNRLLRGVFIGQTIL